MGHNGWILQNPYINNLYSRTCIRKHTDQICAITNFPFFLSLVIMSYDPAVSYYGQLCDLPFTTSQTSSTTFPLACCSTPGSFRSLKTAQLAPTSTAVTVFSAWNPLPPDTLLVGSFPMDNSLHKH